MTQDHATPATGESAIDSLFDTTVRGFNKRQVEDYIGWMRTELATPSRKSLQGLREQADGRRSRSWIRLREEVADLRSESSAAEPPQARGGQRAAGADPASGRRGGRPEAGDAPRRRPTAPWRPRATSRPRCWRPLVPPPRASSPPRASGRRRRPPPPRQRPRRCSPTPRRPRRPRSATPSSVRRRCSSDADQRTGQITSLQDERLAALSEVHTDTLRRLEAVRGVLEKVLIAEADAGPPQSGISNVPRCPPPASRMRAADADGVPGRPPTLRRPAPSRRPEWTASRRVAADFAEATPRTSTPRTRTPGLTAADRPRAPIRSGRERRPRCQPRGQWLADPGRPSAPFSSASPRRRYRAADFGFSSMSYSAPRM